MKRAKFHCGYLNQCCKCKVDLHLCSLSLINNLVSVSLLKLSRITQVLSHPPIIPPYRWSPCCVEVLQHQPLKPHLNVGPTAVMEHKMILSWLPQDAYHNFACLQQLQAKLQALLPVSLASTAHHLLSPLPIMTSSISIQLGMKTSLLLPHHL